MVEGSYLLSRRLFEVCRCLIGRQLRVPTPSIMQADWLTPESPSKYDFGGTPALGLRSLFIYEPDVDVLRKRLDD
jgi:hypothetical protein